MHKAVARAHDPTGDGYYDVEHRYLHPTLGLRWLLTRSSTYFGEVSGKRVPVRTVGAMLDVTARRKSEQEHEQLRAVEEQLDQCWDLLRQRRARREFGEDPSGSAARPASEVEGYLQ